MKEAKRRERPKSRMWGNTAIEDVLFVAVGFLSSKVCLLCGNVTSILPPFIHGNNVDENHALTGGRMVYDHFCIEGSKL